MRQRVKSVRAAQCPATLPPIAITGAVTGVDQDMFVLTVTGDIDPDTAPTMQAALLSALSGQWSSVCCDLSGVRFFAASGVRSLLIASLYAAARPLPWHICGAPPSVSRVIQNLDLQRWLTLHTTRHAP